MTNKPCPSCVETIADWVETQWDFPRRAADLRLHFLPKTPAQELAEQCPHTEKADVIAWMLERETHDRKDSRVCAICDGGPGNNCACNCGMQKWETAPTDPASPRYVTMLIGGAVTKQ